MNRRIMEQAGFEDEMTLVDAGVCPFCKVPIDKDKFRDELSRREFKISGLCQKCQDDVFTEEEE